MFLLGGCASLSPAVAIPNTQTLAGAWRGRVSGFAGNALAVMTIAETGAYTKIVPSSASTVKKDTASHKMTKPQSK